MATLEVNVKIEETPVEKCLIFGRNFEKGINVTNNEASASIELYLRELNEPIYVGAVAESKAYTILKDIKISQGENKIVNLVLQDATSSNSGSIKVNTPTNTTNLSLSMGVALKMDTQNYISLPYYAPDGTPTNIRDTFTNLPSGEYRVNAGAFYGGYDFKIMIRMSEKSAIVENGKTAYVTYTWPNVSFKALKLSNGSNLTFMWNSIPEANYYHLVLVTPYIYWEADTTKNSISYPNFDTEEFKLTSYSNFILNIYAKIKPGFNINNWNWEPIIDNYEIYSYSN